MQDTGWNLGKSTVASMIRVGEGEIHVNLTGLGRGETWEKKRMLIGGLNMKTPSSHQNTRDALLSSVT